LYAVLYDRFYFTKQEDVMERPDLDTFACVNPECQLFRQRAQGNLVVLKVYGRDAVRLLRCRRCGEEFSERRGTALFNTKVSEAKAVAVIEHLGEGCSIRATARLTEVCKETVARLLRVSGRHAGRVHDQYVQGLMPLALEFDEQWSYVKKRKNDVPIMSARRRVTSGIIRPWPLTASWWCP
jgi:transposase-like protein